jgi:hypothetical protein
MTSEVLCPGCGLTVSTSLNTAEDETIQPGVVESTTALFQNGLGAITATSRLATIARRENILVAVAVAIAFDYFSILSHAASLAPVC